MQRTRRAELVVIAAVALLGCSHSESQWVPLGTVWGEGDSASFAYWDRGTITRDETANVIRVWIADAYEVPQRASNGSQFFREVTRIEFDCARRRFRFLAVADYDGAGRVVESGSLAFGSSRKLWVPTSVGDKMEALERAVCPWLVYAVPDTSGSADANGDGGFTAFWNRETLTRKGGVARVWNEWEYSRPQRRPDGKQYIRALYYFAIDCVHQQFRIEAGEYYDSTASHVEDEHDLDNDPDEPSVWHRIDSGTALNGLSTAVCPVLPLSR